MFRAAQRGRAVGPERVGNPPPPAPLPRKGEGGRKRRHAGYGVRDEHYEAVATALIWTLGTGLGDAFTPEVREAWATMYWIVADTMKEGAAEPLARSA